MLSSDESLARFNKVFDERFKEILVKVIDGSLTYSDVDLSAIASEICKTERIYVTDGYRYWNPFQYSISDKEHFIESKPIRGREVTIRGLIRVEESALEKQRSYLEYRKLKRLMKRGKFRTCPICGKEFIPRRSDAMICPMMACKKEAQKPEWDSDIKRRKKYRKKKEEVIS